MYSIALRNIFRFNGAAGIRVCALSSHKPPDGGPGSKKFPKDDEIVAERVRVLKDKKLLGDYTLYEARLIAQNQNLNLILFRPNSDPPICVIDNYREFVKGLAEKEARKDPPSYSFDPSVKSKTVQISENCAAADLNRKLASMRKFLLAGQRVDVVIVTRFKRGGDSTRRPNPGQASPNPTGTPGETDGSDSKGFKATPDSDGSLLQKIDFIYSRLADISRPYTMKNKVNINSRQVLLKFWPK